MGEVWKIIPGYEFYLVSNLGRVRSLPRTIKQKSRNGTYFYRKMKGVLLRPGRNTKQGHVTVSIGRRNSINVHRLVMLAFIGPCPKGKEVLHINGKAQDNRLSNLRYGTRTENNIDISKHNKRLVKFEEVEEIKTCVSLGISISEIAKAYSLKLTTVSAIKRGQNWEWV
jgi:hypothetical protein